MSLVRILTLTALLFTGIALIPQQSEASSSVGFFLGVNRYHPGYYHFYRPYYRPYFYRPYFGGFYHPYSYGYGYPGSYYRNYYLADIRTEVKPQDARVYLDGDYVGVVDDFDGWWQRLEVPPGRHRLTFRAPGFAPYVVDVRVYPGRDAHIKYDLRRGEDQIADLEMRLPRDDRDFDEYDDRDRYRRRDSYRNREDRDRYQRRDRDRYENDRDRKYDDRDRQYDDRDRQYDEKPYFGEQEGRRERDSNRRTFTLDIEPSDATVYVDGNYYGTANDNGGPKLQILLQEGVHRIEVVRPGYNSFSQDITVSRNGENRLAITLQKK
jgi:hypothetical protein